MSAALPRMPDLDEPCHPSSRRSAGRMTVTDAVNDGDLRRFELVEEA